MAEQKNRLCSYFQRVKQWNPFRNTEHGRPSPLFVVFFLVVCVLVLGPCALWSDGMLRNYSVVGPSWTSVRCCFLMAWHGPGRTSGRWGRPPHASTSSCILVCCELLMWHFQLYVSPFFFCQKCLKEKVGEWLKIHTAPTETNTYLCLFAWRPISYFNCLIKAEGWNKTRLTFRPRRAAAADIAHLLCLPLTCLPV